MRIQKRRQSKHAYLQLLQERFPEFQGVYFNVGLAKLGGTVNAGLFLSQLLYWYDKGSNPHWIYKTIKEIHEETWLNRDAQKSAERTWVNLGILEVKRCGWQGKRHYKIQVEKLFHELENLRISLRKPANSIEDSLPPVSGSPPANTEITQESSTEIKNKTDLEKAKKNLVEHFTKH